jgi:hypothetical protein
VLVKKGEAVTLLKSRTLCFKTICSRGITEVIDLTANSVYYCPCSSSQPSRCATIIKRHVLLSLEGGHRERPLHNLPSDTSLSSRWRQAVALTLLRWSPTPHSSQVSRGCLEKPSMKSKAQSREHHVLYDSPRPLPSQHAQPKRRTRKSIRSASHTLLSKRGAVSHRSHK